MLSLQCWLQKATPFAELFSVEGDFTVDTLNEWFSRIIKTKSFEIDSIKKQIYRKENQKQIYRKENPIKKEEAVCSICGFLLDVDNVGWFDFIVKCKHLFLRNIHSADDLEKNGDRN